MRRPGRTLREGRATVKKKADEVTRLRVVDRSTAVAEYPLSANTSTFIGSAETVSTDLEGAILQIVRRDPFASISEIVFDLQRRSDHNAGWWNVFGVLRRNRLLTRRSRFRFAWRRS